MPKRFIFAAAVMLPVLFTGFRPAAPGFEATSSPAGSVTIRRDLYGIPHILAETEEAASFGLGYAQAEDHCLEIARGYVEARGEAARYFGNGADSDFLLKLYGNYAAARRDLGRLTPVYRKVVNAFAAGVNRYVEKHREELPDWIPEFTGVDIMAFRRAGAIRSAFSPRIIRSLREKYASTSKPAGSASASPPSTMQGSAPIKPDWIPVDLPGSNAFALAGTKTDSGNPILVGNPHLNWSSLYWEAQVTVPGKMNFFGSTLAGIPNLRAGFNDHLGWVTTNNAPDVIDVFALTIDPNQEGHYLFNGKSLPFSRMEVSIEIRTEDGKFKTEKREYWDSRLGRIIYRTRDTAFAVASSQIDAFRYWEGFYELSKTRSLKQFMDVMKRNKVPTSNFTYADIDGNIMYMWNARIPKRVDDGTDYQLDVPARNNRYVWKKFLEVGAFPRLLNPSGGYIQNCNNPPWYTSLRAALDPAKYPSYLEEERELALRPQMALQMMESREKFSLEDVKKLKFNDRMLLADRVKPDLIKAVMEIPARSELLDRGLRVMESWDNQVTAGSRGGVLFQRFWDTYSEASPHPFAAAWDPADPAGTPSGLSDPALAVKHFEEAVGWTVKNFGSEDVAWGEVHRFRFGELDLPGDGASGSYGVFRVLRFAEMPDGKRVAGQVKPDEPPVGFGDGWVLAVEFSKPIAAWSVLAYGQTTRSDSRHSSDQIRLFANHELKRVWFSEAEIKANLEAEYRP